MRILNGAAIAGLTLACLVPAHAAVSAPENLVAPGLSQPVEILKDRWGVSHIYAKNENDLFFAQGYNAARDRLFQLELWRRQATGTAAEVMGKQQLKRDIANRLFMFRGDMTAELNHYHPHAQAIVDGFVKGVNAYIDETVKNPALLTPEFTMLNMRPGKWTPAVVISRFNALSVDNVDRELNNAISLRSISAGKLKDLMYFQNGDPDLTIDPAIDTSLLNKGILEYYHAFIAPLTFSPDQLLPAYRNPKSVASVNEKVPSLSAMDLSDRRNDIGSNNWVVSGRLTTSGYPVVVGDPHRVQQIPSLRYWVHLNAPGWNVIGAGEPSVPGVSIGHNEYGAWGLTIFGTAFEDLYVYHTNPANPSQYRYKGGWEDMTSITETIPVKGETAQRVEMKFTRHGPVLHEDTVHHKAYGVRAAWMEPGGAPYMASLRLDQAKTAQEFFDATSYMQVPSENMIWGDRFGDIAYQATAITPKRPNWSGLVPVPGDGRYEWAGFLPNKEEPHVLNPPKGYYNTSNENQIPLDWKHPDAVGYVWADPYRGQSVAEVLGSGRKFTVADMAQLQNNELSIPARSLVPLLRDLAIPNPVSQRAASRLLRWNFSMDKDSVEAGIYALFQRQLIANVREIVVPNAVKDTVGNLPMTRIVAFMHAPDGAFGPNPLAGRNDVLVKSLDRAVADLTQRLGPDMEKWKLGAYHYAKILHPMSGALSPELAAKYDVGSLPRGGDAYTITATGSGDNQLAGGSFKIIVDTENWDNSVGLNNPGQSGDVNDPHYRDLYELWARGQYFPVFFSREKIESVTEKAFTLSPN